MRKTIRKTIRKIKNITKGGGRFKKIKSESSEPINSNNPHIKPSINPHTNSKNKDKLDDKLHDKVENSVNQSRKASYNKNSKSYVCGETNFELILPPTHKPSSSVIGKKNMTFYKIPIPQNTKPGSIIGFKKLPPPIPNIDHNAGKNPPNCPRKQRLNSVNHIPTSNTKSNNNQLDSKTAKYKLSGSIPRLDFSRTGFERMATRANYARAGTTPFTSDPQGPPRETFTPDRVLERGWYQILNGENPLHPDFGVDFSKWKFT